MCGIVGILLASHAAHPARLDAIEAMERTFCRAQIHPAALRIGTNRARRWGRGRNAPARSRARGGASRSALCQSDPAPEGNPLPARGGGAGCAHPLACLSARAPELHEPAALSSSRPSSSSRSAAAGSQLRSSGSIAACAAGRTDRQHRCRGAALRRSPRRSSAMCGASSSLVASGRSA